jgi:heme/copper-type cytochrome/quinol oxidase subunit 2
MDLAQQSQTFVILATVAVGLMVAVTGGIIYLTIIEWRDRRRRKREEQAAAIPKRRRKG